MNRMHRFTSAGFENLKSSLTVADQAEVRIGMVNYINTAPIYEPWKARNQKPGWFVVEAPPSRLNILLSEGELDLGFVSSYEYAARPGNYRILPDLSISASGPVGSVFLFAKKAVSALDGDTVLLTNQSDTSVALTRIILEEFYQVAPRYFSGAITDENIVRCEALLAIGDDALRLKADNTFPYCLDLGEVWSQETGLPFVFAVCAVREDFCQEAPDLLEEVYRNLVSCRDEGCADLEAICRIAAPKIPMNVGQCLKYLKGIEYDLGDAKREALAEYFTYLIRRNEVGVGALPLKMIRF